MYRREPRPGYGRPPCARWRQPWRVRWCSGVACARASMAFALSTGLSRDGSSEGFRAVAIQHIRQPAVIRSRRFAETSAAVETVFDVDVDTSTAVAAARLSTATRTCRPSRSRWKARTPHPTAIASRALMHRPAFSSSVHRSPYDAMRPSTQMTAPQPSAELSVYNSASSCASPGRAGTTGTLAIATSIHSASDAACPPLVLRPPKASGAGRWLNESEKCVILKPRPVSDPAEPPQQIPTNYENPVFGLLLSYGSSKTHLGVTKVAEKKYFSGVTIT